MRNERSYNSSLGPTRVGAIQAPVRVGPKAARVTRHVPPYCVQWDVRQKEMVLGGGPGASRILRQGLFALYFSAVFVVSLYIASVPAVCRDVLCDFLTVSVF